MYYGICTSFNVRETQVQLMLKLLPSIDKETIVSGTELSLVGVCRTIESPELQNSTFAGQSGSVRPTEDTASSQGNTDRT